MQHIPSPKQIYRISRRTARTPTQLEVGSYVLNYIKWGRADAEPHIYRFMNLATKQVVEIPFASTEVADATIKSFA